MKTEVEKWFNDGGDNKFRYNYPINKESVVFDCGGYKGDWSEKIFNLYNCNIYVFEPVKKYYNILSERFNKNNKIKVFNFGLSHVNNELEINLSDDGSSVYIKTNQKEKIKVKSIKDFISEEKISNIDLLKLNVEGEEYNILESIIKNDLINIVSDYQIQFHELVKDYENRREIIRNKLKDTHVETYCYKFVWENWRRIKNGV